MSQERFSPVRRKFLVNLTRLATGVALSSLIGEQAQAAQWFLIGGGRADVPPAAPPGGISMLATSPAELGAQFFAGMPRPLRSSALQLQGLLSGIKPACRLSLNLEEFRESVSYLNGLGCACVVEEAPSTETSYAQMSPKRRRSFSSKPRVRVYLAKTAADARRLAAMEADDGDYRALGLALGYPVCCVEGAVRQDRTYYDGTSGAWRQVNLNAAAVRASTAADFRCNQFLVESDLYSAAPLSAIAHYPCRLDCPESAAIAQAALECSARTWPVWTVALCELLRSPVLYWSDESWPADYWDEYCGLALVEARRVGRSEWDSRLPAMLLGSERTPSGPLPSSATRVLAAKGYILFEGAGGEVVSHRVEGSGSPWLIDWRSGRVERFV